MCPRYATFSFVVFLLCWGRTDADFPGCGGTVNNIFYLGTKYCCFGYYNMTGVCVECTPGNYCNDGITEQGCRPGTYNPYFKALSLLWCLTPDTSCSPGKYITAAANSTSNIVCEPCTCQDNSMYRTGCNGVVQGNCALCIPCDPGYYNLGCGGVSPGVCTPCDPCQSTGTYRNACNGTSPGSCISCVKVTT